jgi:hypothetical protein
MERGVGRERVGAHILRGGYGCVPVDIWREMRKQMRWSKKFGDVLNGSGSDLEGGQQMRAHLKAAGRCKPHEDG